MHSSQFNLWRACFAFCFVDGFLAPEEHEYIETKLRELKFSVEQRSILLNDLKSAPAVMSLLPLITKLSDRGFLVDQMRYISRMDHDFAPSEKAKIEKIRDEVMKTINLEELTVIVLKDEMDSYQEDEVYKVGNKHSYIERLLRKLQKLANPGDRKMP